MRLLRLAILLSALAAVLVGSGCTPKPGVAVRNYAMGEKIELGNLIYIVYDSQWLTQVGEGPGARVPENRYFLVRLSVTNSGHAEAILPNMTLMDDNGANIPELSNGDQIPGWIGYLRRVKPAESLQGVVVFDCSPRRYRLHIADDTEQRVAMVDIPLTFAAETPEIPTPQLPGTK